MTNITRSTNPEITKTLENIYKGVPSASNQLVFDPATGEFVVAKPNQQLSADATTINQIAQDGFATSLV